MSTGPDQPDRPVTRGPQDSDGARPSAAPAGSDAAAPPTGKRADAPSGRRAADRPADARDSTPTTDPDTGSTEVETDPRGGGKTAGLWISLILGAIVLVLLLIFIIQNNGPAQFAYFNAQFELPLGVAMLLAAIAGALIMALVGSVRMVQMSWTIRKLRKQQEKIHRASR